MTSVYPTTTDPPTTTYPGTNVYPATTQPGATLDSAKTPYAPASIYLAEDSPPATAVYQEVSAYPTTSAYPSEPPYLAANVTALDDGNPSRSFGPPHATTNCIYTAVTFKTTWYTHSSAPEAFICSKCYVDHIWPTQFRDQFVGRLLSDGVPRQCRFKVPRITDSLLGEGKVQGNLDGLVQFLNHRLTVPDCEKQAGTKGSQKTKWFRAMNDAIPGLVVCEACFEDIVCISPLAQFFEPALGQGDNQVWSCDLSISYIKKEFESRSKTGDWVGFTTEAKARLGMPACPKGTMVELSFCKWFVPVNGPPDAYLCVACYCDRILGTDQEGLWQQKIDDRLYTERTCCLGQFHLLMAIGAATDYNNWPAFYRALHKVAYEEKVCDPKGIQDGKWFTFPAQPSGFSVCGACYAAILEPLGLDTFFVPQVTTPPPDVPVLCSLNTKSPRFVSYLKYLVEVWLTRDYRSWEAYASKYAAIARCPRDEEYRNRGWFGWKDCVICAECYTDFVEGTALDLPLLMPLRGQQLTENRICEMYSPRMRKMYLEACSSSPPDPTALCAYAVKRHAVFLQTMPVVRLMITQMRFTAMQASTARYQSVVYNNMGGLESVGRNHHNHTYSQVGVGYGFENMAYLESARYNQQANQLSSQIFNGNAMLAHQLEGQWRAVE